MRAEEGDLLRSGREALAAADWERARSCFEQAREREETPEALDGLSEVAHFEGDYDRAIELKELAFAAYRAQRQASGSLRHRALARVPPRDVPRQLRGRERVDGPSGEPAGGGRGVRRPRVADPRPGAVLARPLRAGDLRRRRAGDRQAVRRRRPRVRGARAPRRDLRRGGAHRGGHEAPRPGDGRGVGGRGDGPRRRRGDLLPAAQRVRARRRRQARRGVDGGGSTTTSSGSTSYVPPAGRTTAGSSSRSGAGTRPRRSCSTALRASSAATAATGSTRSSGSPTFACARAATRRRSA